MPISEQINKDLTTAMKAKEQLRLDTLRMVKSALKNREIELRKPVDDAEALKVLNTLVKQRREAAELFVKGGRQDLADKESAEAKIIESYMPAALGEDEIERVVVETIKDLGAAGPKDMGAVMKAVMGKLAGQSVDGKLVNALVKGKLGV